MGRARPRPPLLRAQARGADGQRFAAGAARVANGLVIAAGRPFGSCVAVAGGGLLLFRKSRADVASNPLNCPPDPKGSNQVIALSQFLSGDGYRRLRCVKCVRVVDMTEPHRPRVKYVIGPDGSPLTIADLPAPGTKRWVIRRKAEVVAAVRGGLLSLEEACSRYTLTVEEFLSWQYSIDQHGLAGLRTTRIQQYRQ